MPPSTPATKSSINILLAIRGAAFGYPPVHSGKFPHRRGEQERAARETKRKTNEPVGYHLICGVGVAFIILGDPVPKKNLVRALSFRSRDSWRKACWMLPIIATGCWRKRSRVTNTSGSRLGPISSTSIKEGLLPLLEDASKTILHLISCGIPS